MAVTDFCQDLIYYRPMRGNDQKQEAMFSYLTLAQRIPMDHPARQICTLVNRALERMDAELEKLYSDAGLRSRPSAAAGDAFDDSLLHPQRTAVDGADELQLALSLVYTPATKTCRWGPGVCGPGDGRRGVGRDGVHQES
jgi:hypothetical protein